MQFVGKFYQNTTSTFADNYKCTAFAGEQVEFMGLMNAHSTLISITNIIARHNSSDS